MPEFRRIPALALAIGLLLAVLTAFSGVIAVLGAWLAQPALALAISWWRDSRPMGDRQVVLRQASMLLALWGIGLAVVALLIAWPLAGLRENGSLGAAIGLSLVVGVAWLGLWRTWPVWRGIEREGGDLRASWRQLDEVQIGISTGWRVATLAGAILAGGVLLAWPGLLPSPARWIVVGLYVVALPLLHWLLQSSPAPPALVDDELAYDEDEALAAEEGDLDAALYAAARGGRVDRALALLEAGADPHASPSPDDRDQRTLPLLAAVLPDLRLLRGLIGRGVQVNEAHAGMTPLLAATRDSWHGRPEAVMTLLANGADPRAADSDGNTPLHHAARSTDPGVAALLRDAAAEIDVLNNEGQTPLAIACVAGNWRLARFLLERGARTEPALGQPALLSAAGTDEDDPAGVQLLLKHKAKIDARDARGRSALHEASLAGHAEIVAMLLAAGADAQAVDGHGRTPLLDAAQGGSLAALERLAEARPDVTVADDQGRNALLCASGSERVTPALVRRLLELGVAPDHVDRDGKRAIDRAAECGRWAIVTALDPDYPLPNNVGSDEDGAAPPDRTPLALLREALHEGREDGNDALAKLLAPDELGSLLHDAALTPRAVEWLLSRGADPEARDAHGDNAIFATLARGPAAMPALKAMLQRAVSPAGRGGLARFVAVCNADDQAGAALEDCAIDLLDRGADPFAVAATGDPAMTLAVRLGWIRLADRLIAHGVDPDARDAHGMTSLHLAAALGRETVLKQLIARGASPDMRAADGQTPLGVALSGGRRDLADWLDWRGWPLPRRALQASDVPAAAIVGDADAVRRLLDLGFPVDATDAQGCTALLRAAGGGHRATVDLLLSRSADPGRAANSGATPLSAAVSMRQTEIVDCLLGAGAELEQRLPGDVTALMLAAALGLPDLTARLLTAGADVQASDSQGLMPLHCAALYGFTARERPRLLALIDTLLLAGADADATAAGGVTPLLLLLGARAEPGTACDEDTVLVALDRLLEEEVTLDAQDPRGFGPLHLAALHGLLHVTQRLLRAGSDPGLRDAINRTPREIAVMRGFVDVASEFAPLQSGVSMARFLREPR